MHCLPKLKVKGTAETRVASVAVTEISSRVATGIFKEEADMV
jgi:hypothetical protein